MPAERFLFPEAAEPIQESDTSLEGGVDSGPEKHLVPFDKAPVQANNSLSKLKPKARQIATIAVWIVVAAALVLDAAIPISRSWAQKHRSSTGTIFSASIRPHTFATINSQFPGRVTALEVSLGQTVNVGDRLLVVNNPEFEMEFETANLRLQDVQARIAARNRRLLSGDADLRAVLAASSSAEERLADFSADESANTHESALERVRQIEIFVQKQLATDIDLQQAKSVEQQELRNARAAKEHLSRLKEELEAAQARVESLRNAQSETGVEDTNLRSELREATEAVKIASERLDSQSIVSTISGTVLRTAVNVGDVIPSGIPLVQLGQLELLDIDVPVDAEVVRRLKVGQRVKVRIPTEPPIDTGAPISNVLLVPAAEQSAYTVRITVKNPSVSTVLVGLTAEVEFPH